MHMNKRLYVLVAGMVLVLGGCASTRTQQSPGENLDDRLITGRVKAALIEDPDTKARKIDVETFRGVVQLNGFVDSSNERSKAADVAGKVNGVKQVRNNLQVTDSRTTVATAIDDTVLTGKVKAAIAADSALSGMQVSVETHEGTVLLSGFVDNPEQRTRAAELARNVAGVRDVKNDTEVKRKSYP
jgi:hyperosmotically inducible periplasmic protein